MKKILAIVLAATFLLALIGCSKPIPSPTTNDSLVGSSNPIPSSTTNDADKKMFNIEDDALKFENMEYKTSILTDGNEIYEQLNQTVEPMIQTGGHIDGTDLSFSDCRPLWNKLPEVCEKITGKANHTKNYENAPYESILIFYFETPSDAEQYVELFIPWFKIVQYQKASTKAYTYGQKDNIVYICTIEAYDILMQNS